MTLATDRQALELRSLIRKNGELELSLAQVTIAKPGADEVVGVPEDDGERPEEAQEVEVVGAVREGTARLVRGLLGEATGDRGSLLHGRLRGRHRRWSCVEPVNPVPPVTWTGPRAWVMGSDPIREGASGPR